VGRWLCAGTGEKGFSPKVSKEESISSVFTRNKCRGPCIRRKKGRAVTAGKGIRFSPKWVLQF